jgi:hypothetical protein
MPSPQARLPAPGPSFIRERSVVLHPRRAGGDRRISLGITRPSELADGWWGAFLWAADDGGVIVAREAGPLAGPPPDPPLAVLGPAFAGALSGLIAVEADRQCVRLSLPEADDPARPWDRPLLVRLALKWEPMRAATMRPNELAREALEAWARAIEGAGRPA